MKRLAVLAAALALASCGGGSSGLGASTCGTIAYPGGTSDPAAWYIGPVLPDSQGGDMSRGMPLHPQSSGDGWLYFDLPDDGGRDFPLGEGPKADYVTFNPGSLAGYSNLKLEVRQEAAPDAIAYAVPEIDATAKMPLRITPIIIRQGDNFTASGKYEDARWFHEDPDLDYLKNSPLTINASLKDNIWTATEFSTLNPADGAGGVNTDGSWKMKYNPTGFANTVQNAGCAGFVLGGNENGIGHGGRSRGHVRVYFRMAAEK